MVSLTKKEKRWVLFFYLPLYFIFARYIVSFLFGLLISLCHWHIQPQLIDPWFNLFYDTVLMIIGIFVFRHYLKESIKNMKGRWLSTILWSLTAGFLMLLAVNYLSSLLVTLIGHDTGSANQNAVVFMTQLAPLQMVVASVGLAPILEELVFRVGIFQLLYDRSRILAYLASGLCFGFVHISQGLLGGDLGQLLYLIPYGLLGLVFCRIYEKRQSIFAPMIIHGANNLLSMLVILLM